MILAKSLKKRLSLNAEIAKRIRGVYVYALLIRPHVDKAPSAAFVVQPT
jgi:hypothetical protein